MASYALSALAALLLVASLATPAFAQNRCDAGKVKCVMKRIACLMRVESVALRKGEPADPVKLQKCFDKFDGGVDPSKGCFARLEAKQSPSRPDTICSTTNDAAEVAASADALTESLVQKVSVAQVTVGGTTRDYFTGAAVGSVDLATGGPAPEPLGTSDGSGLFSFDAAAGSTLFVHAARSGYSTTRSPAIAVGQSGVTRDLEVVAIPDVLRQFATLGETQAAGTGLVFVELVDAGDSPLVGVGVGDITLTDGLGSPVADGPFFFGAIGDMDAGQLVSAAFGGRARVGFINCPPGTQNLTVATLSQTYNVSLECVADGVTLGTTVD